MKKPAARAAILRSAAAAAAIAALSSSLTAAESGNAVRGARLYTTVGCYQCHGTVGQGSLVTGPRLAPNPAPLEFYMVVLRRPPNVMPAYSQKVLPDQDIADIHAYLSSL